MARFYGTLRGSKGGVSRLGTAKSGIRLSAQSWYGSILILLEAKNPQDDKDNIITIAVTPDSSATFSHGRVLWTGPVEKLIEAAALIIKEK